jgi:hypothetical protein
MEDTIRIDNPPDQLREYLNATLVAVDFPDGLKLGDYLKQAERGCFLLLTESKREPQGLHVSLLRDGQLQFASPWMSKSKLLGVHQVFKQLN